MKPIPVYNPGDLVMVVEDHDWPGQNGSKLSGAFVTVIDHPSWDTSAPGSGRWMYRVQLIELERDKWPTPDFHLSEDLLVPGRIPQQQELLAYVGKRATSTKQKGSQ